MAADHHETAPAGGLVLLIALAALAVTAAAGFGRVFQGRGATLRLMLAAGIAAMLAGAMERRHIVLAALLSAAGLAVAVGLMIFPETTRFALPTLTTYRTAVTALRAVGHTAQVQVAPAIPLDPLMLAGLTAVWTAAFAAHSLAARARSPFLAILPPAALLAFAGVLVEDGSRPGYAVTFLGASLALLFADGFRRVGHWGPVTMWHARSRYKMSTGTTTRTARRVAAASLGIAAFVPWVLPGFHAKGLLQLHGERGQTFVSIDPIVDIRPALINNRPTQMFTVQTTHAAYWRFVALDTFDGRLWKSSNLDASGGPLLSAGSLQPNAIEPTGLGEPTATTVDARFRFDRLIQPWLPAPFDPISISVQGSEVRYDPEGQVLVSPNGTYRGYTYEVRSELVTPTPQQLDTVAPPSGPELARYTRLPQNLPPDIASIAHRIADDAPTMYRKVLAVQDYLLKFTYDIRVPPGHDVNHLVYFLTKLKRGYCEQFAGSMAVMLRSLGIPARVAVGFTPGRPDRTTNEWVVTSQNAHAWVEVLFPRFGWLAFESTPGRSNPVAIPYIQPDSTPTAGRPGLNTGEGSPGGPQRKGGLRSKFDHPEGISPKERFGTGAGLPVPQTSPLDRWRGRAAAAALALAGLIGLAIPVQKSARRRIVVGRASDSRQRILAVYHVMTEQAADLGMGRRQHETPMEYRARLQQRVPALDGPLDLLTRLTAEAAYADREPSSRQAEDAFASARAVIREIRNRVGAVARMLGWFRLERYSLPR